MAAVLTAPQMSDDATRLRVLDAIRDLKGPFTLPDLCARSGLPPHLAEPALSKLVAEYRSDLDVDERGTLIYRFDPALAAREDIVKADRGRRRKEAFKRGLIAFFKAWTVAMVIIYFIIYVILLIMMLAALAKASGDNNKRSSRRSGGGSLWNWGGLWGSGGYGGWGSARNRRAERRWNRETERRINEGDDPYTTKDVEVPKPSLTQRTWYHLFGAKGIERNPLEAEKELLTYLRAKKGLITNADIVALLGVTYDEADAIGTRLVATYGGEMDLTYTSDNEPVAIYRFPNLMITGAPEVAIQPARLGYLWHVRKQEQALRDNPSRVVPTLNIVNMVLAVVILVFGFPILEIGGAGAVIGLFVFPMTFSVIFLVLGMSRAAGERRGKSRYERDSIRIAMMQLLFLRRTPIVIPRDEPTMLAAGLGKWQPGRVQAVAADIAAELRGEVVPRGDGLELRAPRIVQELVTVDRLRAHASSAEPVGRTVFTTREGVSGSNAIGDVAPPGQVAPEPVPQAEQALADEIAKIEKELS